MQDIIDLTKKLIQFKTTQSRPDEIKRCAAFIEDYFNTCGIVYKRIDNKNTPIIMALPRSSTAPVLLMTHIDVVDGPGELFIPVEKDKRLYGRGSFDNKYAVALSMVLLKNHFRRLQKQGKSQDDLSLGVLITGDEETGGFNGAKKALGEIKTDFCIALDGGSIEKIAFKENGVVKVKLISRTKAVLRDMPWLGENAVEKLIDDFIKWRTYFITSAPAHQHKAMIVKDIHTIESYHGIPVCAEADLSIRFTESDNVEQMFTRMKNELHSKIVIESVKPVFPGGESEHLKLLLDIAKKTWIGFEDDSNDARFFSLFGIKGIIWGADGDASQHAPDEHVNIESVFKLYSLLDEFLRQSNLIIIPGQE